MSLHSAMEWYGLELARRSEHTALADADHTADLLGMIMTGEHREQKAAWAAAMPGRFRVVGAPMSSKPQGTMAKQLEVLYRTMCVAV